MPKFRTILLFVLRFGLIYGLLIAPWPGAKPVYSDYLQSLGRMALADDGPRMLQFQPLTDPDHKWPSNYDTSIYVSNRELLDNDGKAKTFMLVVDAWQMGWTPTAFFLALTLATPVSWRRRLWTLFWGGLCIHGFVLLTVGILIWNESTRLDLVTLTPFWKAITDRLEEQAVNPVGPSFFAGALIWIVVTFRRQDFCNRYNDTIESRRTTSNSRPRSALF